MSSPSAHLDPEIIHALLDGELAPEEARRAESHLAECAECAGELSALQAVFASLASLPELPLGSDLTPAVMARVRRPGRGFWLVALEGACAALGLALGWRPLAGLVGSLGLPRLDLWLADGVRGLYGLAVSASSTVSEPAARWLGSLSNLRLSLPLLAVSLPQAAALVLGAIALWFAGNRLLLRRLATRREAGGGA
jgi:anti-sigma factor RsiW